VKRENDGAVAVLVVLHNSQRFLPALIASLDRIPTPIVCYFLDNASRDQTIDVLMKELDGVGFRNHVFRSLRNNGFGRGINLLSGLTSAEFLFVLNPDTIVESGCLEELLRRAAADPKIGMCEARQSPRAHPKTFDSSTGETSWCTGAAVVIRGLAFEAVGRFDEEAFFMYCEDVDLSWKFWLRGWKCVYVPDAVIQHFTQDILPGKRRTLENYFTFRNSLFLLYRFGSWRNRDVWLRFLLNRFVSRRYSFRSKALYVFAFADHIRYIPYLLKTRCLWRAERHPWIRFEETSLAD
jgi:GT2 family glycosyltransferase